MNIQYSSNLKNESNIAPILLSPLMRTSYNINNGIGDKQNAIITQ